MSEENFRKRSILAAPKNKPSKIKIMPRENPDIKDSPPADEFKDSLIFELEEAHNNLRAAIEESETLINKISGIINNNPNSGF